MSGAGSRLKGRNFERQVAVTFEAAGFTVYGLEGAGDHLVIGTDGGTLHVEAKAHERLQLGEWLRQQEREFPAGVRRALVFKQARRPLYVVEPLTQFVERERLLCEAGASVRIPWTAADGNPRTTTEYEGES